jgi:hypothetical protein
MSMDLQVRYDVLLRENSRLRAQIEHLVKELAGLRAPAPGIIPKTFGASEAQDRLNRTLTADLNAPRCGDHVLHRPSGERWMVAYADADQDTIAWTGWPDGRANLSDCEVVYRCTDEEHRQAVEQWRAAQDSSRRTNVLARYGYDTQVGAAP